MGYCCRQNPHRIATNKRAVSTVITSVLVTSILLIILLIASFVATNVLTLQMNSTEFEQAKTNMILLDSTIRDVALRPYSGGYVQFNERTGGIGVDSEEMTVKITVQSGTGETKTCYEEQLHICSILYRAGSLTSAVALDLTGSTSLGSVVSASQPLGYARVLFDDGLKIKLDYNRVSVTPVGLIDGSTNLIEINFIRLIKGPMGGSGTTNVKIENVNTTTIPILPILTGTDAATIYVTFGSQQSTFTCDAPAGATTSTNTVVLFTEIQVCVSKS